MNFFNKLLIAAILFLPAIALASTSVPWSVTNLTDTFIFPNLVNGNAKGVLLSASSTVNADLTAANGIILSATSSPFYSQGRIVYDTSNESPTFFNNDSNISLQIGQEEWTRVWNNTGSIIANGSPVYISGTHGVLPQVSLSDATASDKIVTLGLATEDIANSATGTVTTIGVVHGINTLAFTAGANVYVATTPGTLTTTAPTSPNYRYRVGVVTVSSATVGSIQVTPTTAAVGNGTAGQFLGINGSAKQAFLSFLYPLVSSGTGVSLAFGTTTSNTWAGTQTFTNAPVFSSLTGLLKGNGSSAVTTASNGTDFSLITALACSAGQFFQQTTAAGVFTCGTPAGTAFPFTPTNNFGVNTNATSTILSFFAGFNASSTSRVASTTFDVTGFVGIGTSTNDVAGSKFALAVSNSVASLGGLLISTWTNVTNAFRIVNAAGATVFNVDTTAANPFLGVGTTTPWGTLSAVGNGTNPIFAVASSSNTGLPNFMIDAKGYIVTSGVAPVASSCGTSPVISGNDTDWRVHIGSTLASSCTITFSQSRGTATNPPICVITQETGTAIAVVASTTQTAVVVSGGTFTSDWFVGHCAAYQ